MRKGHKPRKSKIKKTPTVFTEVTNEEKGEEPVSSPPSEQVPEVLKNIKIIAYAVGVALVLFFVHDHPLVTKVIPETVYYWITGEYKEANSSSDENKKQSQKTSSTAEQVENVSKSFLGAFLANDTQMVQRTSVFERRILTSIKLEEAVREYSRLIHGSMEMYNKATGLNTQIKYGVSGYTAIDKTHAAVDMKIVLGPDTIYLPSITVVRKDTGWKVDFESFMITLHQSVGN